MKTSCYSEKWPVLLKINGPCQRISLYTVTTVHSATSTERIEWLWRGFKSVRKFMRIAGGIFLSSNLRLVKPTMAKLKYLTPSRVYNAHRIRIWRGHENKNRFVIIDVIANSNKSRTVLIQPVNIVLQTVLVCIRFAQNSII